MKRVGDAPPHPPGPLSPPPGRLARCRTPWAHYDSTVQEYSFRTEPFAHQREEWLASRDAEARAIFWEQGTGKSKLTIDTAGWLWAQGRIDAVVVVAPNGVHRNWVVEELPKHLPEGILARTRMHTYQTVKAGTKWHQSAVKDVLHHRGLAILAMSYDAVMTEPGRKTLWDFLKKRRCLYVADEARRIKTPGAKRTKRMVASGKYAPYRRILNGTPVPNSPFDLYSQLRFLHEKFWLPHSIGSFEGFKTVFGVFRTGYNGKGKEYKVAVDYQNVPRLKQIVDTIGTRVTKEDVLDLPPKIFTRRSFDLAPRQRQIYDQLREEYMLWLESMVPCDRCGVEEPEGLEGTCARCGGEREIRQSKLVTAGMALVRLLRLQQVACGYLSPDGEDEPAVDIVTPNPRLELMRELALDLPHSGIIWARFRRDIDLIMEMLKAEKVEAVRYDGKVDDDGRALALERFQEKRDAQFFVANPVAAGEGLTLTAARSVYYYSNGFDLSVRLQSEDRAHRIGQEFPVDYTDIIATGTVDEIIVRSQERKFNVAAQITGDALREWVS